MFKIKAIACDQGSNFVRLAGQIDQQEERFEKIKPNQTFVEELLDTDSENEDSATRNVSTLPELEVEVEMVNKAYKSIECQQRIRIPKKSQAESTTQNAAKSNHDPKVNLNLVIGGTDVTRISCACHKLNLVVKNAIRNHDEISKLLDACNSLGANVRRSVKKSAPYRELRCMLRCENTTRWSSSFLMLAAILKARAKGAISNNEDDENFCDLDFNKIEVYYQILREVHSISLQFQKISSSICEVVPGFYELFIFIVFYRTNSSINFILLKRNPPSHSCR